MVTSVIHQSDAIYMNFSSYYCFVVSVCGLPDSFQSWFLVAQLHVWLCLVRLKREGKDGEFVIRQFVQFFWKDVEERMRVLGVWQCVFSTCIVLCMWYFKHASTVFGLVGYGIVL